jgi:hypothetical protein
MIDIGQDVLVAPRRPYIRLEHSDPLRAEMTHERYSDVAFRTKHERFFHHESF